ncbi:hypothetical protein Tco_0392128, partial [Tanacetum coccineum]
VNTPGSDEDRLQLYDLMYILVNVAACFVAAGYLVSAVIPAGSSSSVPVDYVSAGHVLVPADRDRIC